MDCSKANEYFMKYMDNTLTEDEAHKLYAHIESCEECRADFAVYEDLASEFSKAELIEAPADLEMRVMAEIKKLPAAHQSALKSANTLLGVVSVGFFAILTLGVMLFINRDLVLEFLQGNEQFAPYVSVLTSVNDFVTGFTSNVWGVVTGFGTTALSFADSYKYVILTAALVLLAVQVVIYNRSKSKSQSDKVEE